jgi:hypothetical protein
MNDNGGKDEGCDWDAIFALFLWRAMGWVEFDEEKGDFGRDREELE